MDRLTIRSAIESDMHHIYNFICELENKTFPLDSFSRYFVENLQSTRNHYLIAEVEGNAVGFLSCHGQVLLHHNGLVYEIQELFVSEEHRDRKIGKLLLEALEERLQHEDYQLLEVASNIKRTDAHRFYLTNGFEQTHYKFTKPKK